MTQQNSHGNQIQDIPQTGFFGHPRGLGVLFFVEFWERFSYYGMRALLIFYMYFAVTDNGLGIDKTTAMSIMSVYGSLIYMTSIPGGTFNDFTKTLNIAPNHKQASEQMISAQVGKYDVIKINNQYALNFVGLGLIVQNAENVQDGSKDIFGKLSYIGSTVKTLLNPTQFNYQLSIDDKTYSGETTMILTANGPFIGGSRIPLTDLSPQDGELNTFIFNEQSFSILNDIFKKRDSMNWNEITQGIEHIPGKKISLTTDPAMKVDIDGEISLETPIDIEVIPNAIQLLTVNDL